MTTAPPAPTPTPADATVTLAPDLRAFLEGEVRAGKYVSVQAAIEAAVENLMFEAKLNGPLDEETLDAIDQAEDDIVNGRVYTLEEAKRHLSSTLGMTF